jgi:hypothetical protein
MFYRIDYEKLNRFIGGLCEQDASRCGESDRIDVRSDHISYTETPPDTPLPEQQTAVVSKEQEQDWEESDRAHIPPVEQEQKWREDKGDRSPILLEETDNGGEDTASAPSSGKSAKNKTANFPELMDRVAQVLGLTSLPKNLRRAISQYPEQVEGAIAYLQHQQEKRRIENPVGYLYEAIVSGWTLPVSQNPSIVPPAFSEWFNRARVEGLVVAAMVIDGVHHTLHSQQGWMPTVQLMQESPLEIE